MSSEKTEEPTHKKIRDAREEGQVAHSKDFTQTLLTLALFGYMLLNSKAIVESLGQMIIYPAGLLRLSFGEALNTALTELFWESVWMLLPFLLIVIGLGLFAEMLQTGMLFAFKAMKPSGKKLNVVNNVKNIFSAKNLFEFLKSNIKIIILTVIVYFLIRDALGTLITLPRGGLMGVTVALGLLMKSLILKVSLGYAVLAAFDFVWQRRNHTKQLMMTKDEVKREYKEMEGDPHIKHHRRHLHQEMQQEGAVQNTRKATALITNPTHLAIAIYYEDEKTPLPIVLAKGEGALANRMMQAAREEGIPILQNIPLARALMETAQVEQYIPSDLIEPVAQVLRMVREISKQEPQ